MSLVVLLLATLTVLLHTCVGGATAERPLAKQVRLRHDNPRASYVLSGFPDTEHDVAIVLSQSDGAKICFELCFAAAGAATSAPDDDSQDRLRLLRVMYGLLLEGASSGPGELEREASDSFPGEDGFGTALRCTGGGVAFAIHSRR